MGINLTSQIVHYLLVKMTNQMVHYFVSQKDHPNHKKHVEINLSKMMKWFFLHLSKLGVFFTRFVD